jgi:hypothetical protein
VPTRGRRIASIAAVGLLSILLAACGSQLSPEEVRAAGGGTAAGGLDQGLVAGDGSVGGDAGAGSTGTTGGTTGSTGVSAGSTGGSAASSGGAGGGSAPEGDGVIAPTGTN